MHLGPWEILIVFFIALLLFGGKRIPKLAKSIGSSIKNFKKGIHEEDTPDGK